MNSPVSPAPGRMRPRSSAAVSSARTTVVPTAHVLRPAAFARLTISAVAGGIKYGSGCITWAARSSTSTGLNVPGPMCRSSATTATPLARSASSSSGVKCNPAVGAATLPSCSA